MDKGGSRDFLSIGWLKDEGGKRPYLGDCAVVYGILQDLVKVVIELPEVIVSAIDDATAVLTGQAPYYAPVGVEQQGHRKLDSP